MTFRPKDDPGGPLPVIHSEAMTEQDAVADALWEAWQYCACTEACCEHFKAVEQAIIAREREPLTPTGEARLAALDALALANMRRAERSEARLVAAEKVVAAARDAVPCDHNENDTWCFTCHDERPCTGDDLRAALAEWDAMNAEVQP